jgi:hypothetical protein
MTSKWFNIFLLKGLTEEEPEGNKPTSVSGGSPWPSNRDPKSRKTVPIKKIGF